MLLEPDPPSDGDPSMTPSEAAPRRRRPAARAFEAIPELSGLAQVVGLALGSPEFQRK